LSHSTFNYPFYIFEVEMVYVIISNLINYLILSNFVEPFAILIERWTSSAYNFPELRIPVGFS